MECIRLLVVVVSAVLVSGCADTSADSGRSSLERDSDVGTVDVEVFFTDVKVALRAAP
ncbi:MAG: hypothetical protein MPN21_02420 [Thermoanaerobaculia bacterium]|nr:hypothetical protein [Thermoanaerobaculia bacterium]